MSKEEIELSMCDDRLLFMKGKKQIELTITEIYEILVDDKVFSLMSHFNKKWATQKEVKIIFSIGRDRLQDLVVSGYIRADPGSGFKTSTRLYCCEDLDNYLKAHSSGSTPKIMRGKK